MTRGPRPWDAIRDALRFARLRGLVQLAERGPETMYDFTIVATCPVAFVRIRYTRRILASLEEIAVVFRQEIRLLRAISSNPAISPELWLRSKHGTWRFFRVSPGGLIELDPAGNPLEKDWMAGSPAGGGDEPGRITTERTLPEVS